MRSPRRASLHCQQLQSKTKVEFTAVVGAATGQTCDCGFDLAHAGEIAPAIWTTINETRGITFCRKGQRMASLFTRDSQISTGLLPLGPVLGNPPPPCTKLREKMRKLVSQCAIDLRGVRHQSRVQRNKFLSVIGAAGSRFETRIPFDANLVHNALCA